jgi:hypothetical protein
VYAKVRTRHQIWFVGPVDDHDLEPGGGVTLGDARLVALPDGQLIAVWRGGEDPDYVRWSRRSIGGDWSPSALLATPCCSGLGDLVAAADGSATLMYFDEGSPFTATLPPGHDEWEEGEQLGGQADGFSLATAPDGGVVALWADGCNSVNECVYAAFKSPGQPWGDDELVNETSDDVSGIALAARPGGGFTAAWAEGGPPGSIRARDRSPGAGGTWGDYQTVVELSADDHAGCRFNAEVDCLDLAPAADGRLVAVWQQGQPAPILRQQLAPVGPAVAASVRSAAGVWGEAELVGDPGINEAKPHAAFTADGKVAAAWVADNVTRASWRSLDGSWTTTNLGGQADDDDPTQHQDVAADADGNAATAWLEPAGVRVAGFDGVGPGLKVVSIPTAGTVGQTLTFAADADDAWTYNTPMDWSLGDGTTRRTNDPELRFANPGLTFTHAYTAPGTYNVTVTATDGRNTITRSGTVTITPPTVNCGTADADKDKIGDACDSSDGSKPPVPFKTVSATVVSGDVFIKFPGGAGTASASQAAPKGFTRLQGSATIPVGSTLDTSRGRVRLRSAADIRKGTQQGEFFDGVFKIGQVRKPRGKARKRPIGLITDLTLSGGSFSRCGAQASARSKRKVRRLWGDGKGSFRTTGRHAAATVRGTRWLDEDRCDGTLVRVRRGRVEVRDKRSGRTVQVRAGHSYIARPR